MMVPIGCSLQTTIVLLLFGMIVKNLVLEGKVKDSSRVWGKRLPDAKSGFPETKAEPIGD